MAAKAPHIPKAETILVSTGNIVNWNRLKRKRIQSPTEELSDCLGSTLGDWLQTADKTNLQYATNVECRNEKYVETLPKEEREELKLTVKIFLCRLTKDAVLDAINAVVTELGTSYIDQTLLSVRVGPLQTDGTSTKVEEFLEMILPLYQTLEDLHGEEKIHGIGVSDLDKDKLEALYNASKIKPIIDQVNLTSCCVMPPQLVEYAKENDIQLLTHNDPADILTTSAFQTLVQDQLSEKDSEDLVTSWVVRYSVVVKCRGIIKGKGYIVKAIKDTHKMPILASDMMDVYRFRYADDHGVYTNFSVGNPEEEEHCVLHLKTKLKTYIHG